MQRQRGELIPVGKIIGGLSGPVQAIREASPKALHHFPQADQVNQLVGASEADPDLGFMARMMALCMTAGGGCNLPFGNFPRLLLAWVSTEAVRTQSRELDLGRSLSEFMRSLDVYTTSGGTHTRLRNQMKRLFNAHIQLV